MMIKSLVAASLSAVIATFASFVPNAHLARIAGRADSLTVRLLDPNPITVLDSGQALPLRCTAYRWNEEFAAEYEVRSTSGTVTGRSCDTVVPSRSGPDTVILAIGDMVRRLPVVVSIRPRIDSTGGTRVVLQNAPNGVPWAPSVRRNSLGQVELYLALYNDDNDPNAPAGRTVADLHRFVSSDGYFFRYDGIALPRDTTTGQCTPRQDGVEHIAIVPRADSAGWRMFFASGTVACYGWQTFSAVSTDERNWRIEPGVRIPNDPSGGLAGAGIWPNGEGMEVDKLPDGTWRMIIGAQEPVQPPRNTWQILEYRSRDQLHWTYAGPVLRTTQMPRSAPSGSLQSPGIVEFVPGLYRMFFTADERGNEEGVVRSAGWSAVSTDRKRWQIEGRVLGGTGNTDRILYVDVLGGTLYFIRDQRTLAAQRASATVVESVALIQR